MEVVSPTVDQLGELCDAVCLDSAEDLLAALRMSERFHAKIAVATRLLGQAGVWQLDGALSMTSWLEHQAPMTHAAAARVVRDGKFLTRYPAVAAAVQAGELSAAQVAAMQAVVTAPTADLFDRDAGVIAAAVQGLNFADTVMVCRDWQERAEAVADMPPPTLPDQSFTTAKVGDGTSVSRIVLGPAATASLEQALATAGRWEGKDDTRTAKQRNADAFEDIIGFFNANHDRGDTPRHRPHVELHVQASDLASLDGACAVTTDGQLIPTWATDVWLCDCVIHRVLRAGSTVSDYGRATRSVPTNLYRMVVARDGGCRFDCDRKVAWCDAHHITWWRRHGETKLDNLILLCAYHHRLVHSQPWDIQLHANGDVTFTSPTGRIFTSRPHSLGVPRGRPPATGPPLAA